MAVYVLHYVGVDVSSPGGLNVPKNAGRGGVGLTSSPEDGGPGRLIAEG